MLIISLLIGFGLGVSYINYKNSKKYKRNHIIFTELYENIDQEYRPSNTIDTLAKDIGLKNIKPYRNYWIDKDGYSFTASRYGFKLISDIPYCEADRALKRLHYVLTEL